MAKIVGLPVTSDIQVQLQTAEGVIKYDADAIPSVILKDANGAVLATYDSATNPAVTKVAENNGLYRIIWTPGVAGELSLTWAYEVKATGFQRIDSFTVFSVASQNGLQSDTQITNFIKRRFGDGVVGVELTADQLDDAIDEAKRWYMSLIGQEKYYILTIDSSGGAHAMPADCQAVTEVSFDTRTATLYDQFDWAGVELGPLNYNTTGGGPGGGYSYLVQSMQYREDAKTILGVDRDWYWDVAQQKLILFPSSGTNIGTKCAVRYLTTSIDVSSLNGYEFNLVRRYAFASAMEILGYIRTKYADVPSAMGTVTLNGDTMLSNADMIKDDCAEKLKALRPPTPAFAM